MRYLVLALIVIINFVLTKDLFGQMTLAGALPNLNLLLVIITASESERLDFLFLAVVAGLVTDIGFGLPIGTFALGFAFAGFVSHLLFNGPMAVNITWKNFALVVALAVFLNYLWVIVFSKIGSALGILPYSFPFIHFWRSIVFILIYNLVLAFPMFWLYGVVTGYLHKFNRKTHLIG